MNVRRSPIVALLVILILGISSACRSMPPPPPGGVETSGTFGRGKSGCLHFKIDDTGEVFEVVVLPGGASAFITAGSRSTGYLVLKDAPAACGIGQRAELHTHHINFR